MTERGPHSVLEVALHILCMRADQSSERSVAISISKHETLITTQTCLLWSLCP